MEKKIKPLDVYAVALNLLQKPMRMDNWLDAIRDSGALDSDEGPRLLSEK